MMVTAREVEADAVGGGFSRLNLDLTCKSVSSTGFSWYLDAKTYNRYSSLIKSVYLLNISIKAPTYKYIIYLNIKIHIATSV